MFTSEHWRRLRDTSRPRLAFSAGLGLAFTVTLVLCTRALAVWTSDQNYRIQAVNALGPETRGLLTGSSHVFATLNPALIHIPSMNLAAPVCSYVCVEGIVRGNLAKVPQLEALVIELDAVPLFYDTLRAYRGDSRPLLELDPDLFAMAISPWQKYELWRDRTLDALLARLKQDLPGSFVYWDFGELPWLLDTDYRNGDHINDNAAARVSAAFQQKLESWLGGATSRADEPRQERTVSATNRSATNRSATYRSATDDRATDDRATDDRATDDRAPLH